MICTAWNGAQWLAGDTAGYVAYSANGIYWTQSTSAIFTTAANGFAWNGTLWVAVGSGTYDIAYSSNGINWTVVPTQILGGAAIAVAWNGTVFVAVASSGSVLLAYSYDGINWTQNGKGAITGYYKNIAANGTMFVGVGAGTNQIAYSYDGILWTGAGNPFVNQGISVAWNGNMWLAVGGNSGFTLSSSPNGVTWSAAYGGLAASALTWNGSYWIGVGSSVSNSRDGITFSTVQSGLSDVLVSIASRIVLPNAPTIVKPVSVRSNNAIAIGPGAGSSQQSAGAIAIGYQAGFTGQNPYTVAIGYQAGFTGHGTGSVAIGYQAGYLDGPGPHSIAIGTQAGQYGLGSNSIAIGYQAGPTGVGYSNNIILNAQGVALNPSTGSAFYTAPIRNTNNSATVTADTSNTLFYNPSTFEITYAPSTTNTLAWTSYTPTWAADSGTVSIGNGQLTGSYKQIGKTVFFLLRIVLGSTSSVSGSTGWRLGLPITSVASPSVVANATYLQNGVAYYSGTANNEYNGSTTYVSPLCLVAAPVTGKLTQVNATTPFSWGTADTLTISGTYQSV